MATRLHTQDPTQRLTYLGVRQRAIREHLLRRLTEKQYRRVALLYGFDGEPMSEREASQAEGIVRWSLRDSVYLAIGKPVELDDGSEVRQGGKVSHDWCLWALWVLGNFFTPPGMYNTEKDEATNLREAEIEQKKWPRGTHLTPKAVKPDDLTYDRKHQTTLSRSPQDLQELARQGFVLLGLRPGEDGWETDRFHSESRYDREVDDLLAQYEDDEITSLEWEVEMLVSYARDQHRDVLEKPLRQELEWAVGAWFLGFISEREKEKRVSEILRSHVR